MSWSGPLWLPACASHGDGRNADTIEGLVELNTVMQAPSGHARRPVRGGTVLFYFSGGGRNTGRKGGGHCQARSGSTTHAVLAASGPGSRSLNAIVLTAPLAGVRLEIPCRSAQTSFRFASAMASALTHSVLSPIP